MNNWLFLFGAIFSEVVATSTLKATEGFTKLLPSIVVVCGYVGSFYLLSLTLRTIPVGIAYAIWSGIGVALVTLIGWIYYGQSLDKMALLGIGLIVTGAIILNIYSRSH